MEFVWLTVSTCYGVCLSLLIAQGSYSRDDTQAEQCACNPNTDTCTSTGPPEMFGIFLWQGDDKAVKAAEYVSLWLCSPCLDPELGFFCFSSHLSV